MCDFLNCHAVTFGLQNPHFSRSSSSKIVVSIAHTGFSASDWKRELLPGHGIATNSS